MGNTTNCSWWVWNKNNKMERKKEKKKRGKMDGDVVEGISNLFKATTRKKKKRRNFGFVAIVNIKSCDLAQTF